jgi:hypothetical protein
MFTSPAEVTTPAPKLHENYVIINSNPLLGKVRANYHTLPPVSHLYGRKNKNPDDNCKTCIIIPCNKYSDSRMVI